MNHFSASVRVAIGGNAPRILPLTHPRIIVDEQRCNARIVSSLEVSWFRTKRYCSPKKPMRLWERIESRWAFSLFVASKIGSPHMRTADNTVRPAFGTDTRSYTGRSRIGMTVGAVAARVLLLLFIESKPYASSSRTVRAHSRTVLPVCQMSIHRRIGA